MGGLSQVQLDVRRAQWVEKTGAALINGYTSLFAVTGRVAIIELYGRVTTNVSGAPNFKLSADLPEAKRVAGVGTPGDLCAAAAIGAFTTVNRASLQGNPANPLIFNNTALAIRTDFGHREIEAAGDGLIYQHSTAADDGVWAWELTYLPLRPGSRVVAV